MTHLEEEAELHAAPVLQMSVCMQPIVHVLHDSQNHMITMPLAETEEETLQSGLDKYV